MRRMIMLAAAAGTLAGCGTFTSHVESDDSALGRVVVYRNGIAYFERRARAEKERLVLRVPHDKVDDFLKSLTVSDATSGKPYPISFPTQKAGADGMVEMTIQLPSGAGPEVVLSYITESPAWKPSYRVVVSDAGKVTLQGWAIVDNTSGEDWKSVQLGVGSSSALSFRYDLRSVRLVHRETLEAEERFASAPPRGGSVHTERPGDGAKVVTTLADNEIPRPEGHPDVVAQTDVAGGEVAVSEQQAVRSRGSGYGVKARRGEPTRDTGKVARSARPGQRYHTASNQRVKQLAQQLAKTKKVVVIEGYADKSERDGQQRALDRANMMRNQLIKEGVPPAQLRVNAKGAVDGKAAGVAIVEKADAPAPPGDQGTVAGDPIGESHFESKSTMTVPRGTSAMVSILSRPAEGEVVYLYDAEAARGDARYAFKAVRFENPTDSTLESGPFTVYGDERFIGEGLAEPIPPHATAFVPFAMDRQIVVDRRGSTGDRIARLLTVQRGVVTAEVQHLRTTKLKLTNRLPGGSTVYVRHTVRKGWELTDGPEVLERLGEAHLFAIELKGGETRTVSIQEATPITRTIDLRSDIGLEMVRVYLQTPHPDKRFEEPMRRLLALHAEMANLRQEITSTRERMVDYRARLDELHLQIVDLEDVKAGGGKLMRHLKDKMVEISERLQSSTIEVVDLQQKLTLAKIRFQDGVAELSLSAQSPVASRQ